MKINITLSLDEEIVHKIREQDNGSGLVNKQMKDYFDGIDYENKQILIKKLAEMKQYKKETSKKIRKFEEKLKKIKEKESKILNFARKYPDYVFKVINGSSDVMKFFGIYRNDPKLKRYPWIELKKLYMEVKNV